MSLLTKPHRRGFSGLCPTPSAGGYSHAEQKPPKVTATSLLPSHKSQSSSSPRWCRSRLSPVPWAGTPVGPSTEEPHSKHRIPGPGAVFPKQRDDNISHALGVLSVVGGAGGC